MRRASPLTPSGTFRAAAVALGLVLCAGFPLHAGEGLELPPAGALVNLPTEGKAYAPGERLAFRLSWSGLVAGHAAMSVAEEVVDGRPMWLLTSTTRSTKAIDWFYPVRDRVESRIDPDTGIPLRIEIDQHHGRRTRVRTTVFDQAAHQATTFQPGHDPVMEETPPNVHDILSCLYYLRSFPRLEPGETYVIDVHEGKKNWRLLVHALRREPVGTPAGAFDTVAVRAEVRFKGVFFDRGDVRIWFTDDARHLPVKVQIKIRVGSVLAELVDSTLPALPVSVAAEPARAAARATP